MSSLSAHREFVEISDSDLLHEEGSEHDVFERKPSLVFGMYKWTKFRLSLLQFLVGKGFLLGKIVVGLDNLMVLLLNTSVNSIQEHDLLAVNIVVVVLGGLFALLYACEWLLNLVALRKLLFKSPSHLIDLVVVILKVATVICLFVFFDHSLTSQIAYPALMIYTGLRTILRSNCRSYNNKWLRAFQGSNLDFGRVLSCLRQLKKSDQVRVQNEHINGVGSSDSGNSDIGEGRGGSNAGGEGGGPVVSSSLTGIDDSQLAKLEQLLSDCAQTEEGVIHANELHQYLLLVGDSMPADVAAKVASALSTVTVAVTVLECSNVFLKGPLFCTGSVRNADGRPLSLLGDKARMRVSYKKTNAATTNNEGFPTWENDELVFEGLPRETEKIRIDIGDGKGQTKAAYRLQIPISSLRKGVILDKWYEMDVRGRKESLEKPPKRVKLPKLHVRIRYVMSTFSSQKSLPRFFQDEYEQQDHKNSANNGDIFANTPAASAYGVGAVVKSTFKHWLPQWHFLLFGFLVLSAQAAVVPLTAFVTQILVDDVLKDRSSDKTALLVYCLGGLSGLYALGMVSGFLIGWVQARVNANATLELRKSVLNVVLCAGTKFHEQHSEGELSALFATDVSRVNNLWQSFFWNLLGPLFSILFAMGYLFRLSPNAGIMAYGFLAIVFSGGPKTHAAEQSRSFSKENASVTSEYQNAVQCEKVIRTYKISDVILRKFLESVKLLNSVEFGMMFWASNMQQYVETTLNFFTTLQTVSLALQTFWGNVNLGQFVALTGLYASLVRPASSLGGFSRVALSNAGSLQRVDQVLHVLKKNSKIFKDNTPTRLAELHYTTRNSMADDRTPAISSSNGRQKDERKVPLLSAQGDVNMPQLPARRKTVDMSIKTTQNDRDIITFTNVCFKYQESEPLILNDFKATIQRGTYCCLTGQSGCGKSTLLSILMGFYVPARGEITIDKKDLIEDAAEVSNMVGVVFQTPLILNGTIFDNIQYGKWGASREACEKAARRAKCDFVWKLDKQLDTVVGANGVSLSGGQMQRICLARGLVRNPSILLLDEVTSALDGENEAAIVDTLEDLAKSGMTILSVTHRLKTCLRADKILMLSKGKVIDEGTYQELIQADGPFARMVAAQERPIQGRSSREDNKEAPDEKGAEELLAPSFNSSTVSVSSSVASDALF